MCWWQFWGNVASLFSSHTIYVTGVRGVTLAAEGLKPTHHQCWYFLSIFCCWGEANRKLHYSCVFNGWRIKIKLQNHEMDPAIMIKTDQLCVNLNTHSWIHSKQTIFIRYLLPYIKRLWTFKSTIIHIDKWLAKVFICMRLKGLETVMDIQGLTWAERFRSRHAFVLEWPSQSP